MKVLSPAATCFPRQLAPVYRTLLPRLIRQQVLPAPKAKKPNQVRQLSIFQNLPQVLPQQECYLPPQVHLREKKTEDTIGILHFSLGSLQLFFITFDEALPPYRHLLDFKSCNVYLEV